MNNTPDGGSIKELHLSTDSNLSQGQRGEPVGSAADTPVREVPMTPVSARSNRSTQSYTSGELKGGMVEWEGCSNILGTEGNAIQEWSGHACKRGPNDSCVGK